MNRTTDDSSGPPNPGPTRFGRYRLVDFGDGRKLEALGDYLIDRPSPAAEGIARRSPTRWSAADACFDSEDKAWRFRRSWPNDLLIDCGRFSMPVRPTPFGHIGLFPEQAPQWQWLGRPRAAGQTREALNLFAYTGASTLALAEAGYRVAHVDAARPNVQAAREAAEANGWGDRPIRYLVDDAAKFAAREQRRGRRYHTIVLDPPAYGHSPRGKAWRLPRDLWPLLETCLRLIEPDGFRLLVTGHSPHVGPQEISRFLRDRLDRSLGGRLRIETGRSQLKDDTGRPLDAGFFVRAEKVSGTFHAKHQRVAEVAETSDGLPARLGTLCEFRYQFAAFR